MQGNTEQTIDGVNYFTVASGNSGNLQVPDASANEGTGAGRRDRPSLGVLQQVAKEIKDRLPAELAAFIADKIADSPSRNFGKKNSLAMYIMGAGAALILALLLLEMVVFLFPAPFGRRIAENETVRTVAHHGVRFGAALLKEGRKLYSK